MKKFGKKLMALAMAGVMMCSPIVAAAAEVDITEKGTAATGYSVEGSGEFTGWADSDVFIVVLPTDEDAGSIYNFKLDPQHLLYLTDTAEEKTYNDPKATVWFGTNGGSSGKLTAKSKSNMAVDLSVSATMSDLKGTGYEIVMTDDNTFADDTSTSLYMGVTLGDDTVAIAKGATTATATATMDAVPADKFEIKKTEDNKFKYEFVGNAEEDAKSVSFSLTSACNDGANWANVAAAEGVNPKVTVAWSIKPNVPELTYSKRSTYTGAISVTTADTVKSAKLIKFNGAANSNVLKAGTNYTTSGNTFTLIATWAAGIKSETIIELTLANGQTQTLTVKVEDTPSPLTVTKTAGSSADITVTTFDEVKSAKLVKFNGSANSNALTAGTNYNVSGTNFTLVGSWVSKVTNETVISLTLADGQTQTLTITVK